MRRAEWNKGCESAECVEVMPTLTRVAIRNSQYPEGPWLSFSHEEWIQFLDAVKEGKFDL